MRFESSYADLVKARVLWNSGKHGAAYFFSRLAEQKADRKPKAFSADIFVPGSSKQAIDYVVRYFGDLIHLFYANKMSPSSYGKSFEGCFSLLRSCCENVQLLDESLRLYLESVRMFECGKLDDAIYTGADAFFIFQYLHGMRDSLELGSYRKMFTFVLNDVSDLDGFDLLNGWKFTGAL